MIAALFTGSRHWTDREVICSDLEQLPIGSLVIVGDCPTGVDAIVREELDGMPVRVEVFAADWDKDGKAAGPIRNSSMVGRLKGIRLAGYDTRAIAYLTDHPCRGTRDCMAKLRRAGFEVTERVSKGVVCDE